MFPATRLSASRLLTLPNAARSVKNFFKLFSNFRSAPAAVRPFRHQQRRLYYHSFFTPSSIILIFFQKSFTKLNIVSIVCKITRFNIPPAGASVSIFPSVNNIEKVFRSKAHRGQRNYM